MKAMHGVLVLLIVCAGVPAVCALEQYQLVDSWGGAGTLQGQFWNPNGIAVDGYGNVYVADYGNDRVQKFSADGGYIRQWLNIPNPAGIAVSNLDGTMWITDWDNDHVYRVGGDLQSLTLGGSGTSPGLFDGPWGVAIDSGGWVNVVDNGNRRVQIYNDDGYRWSQIGPYGLSSPTDVAASGLDWVYVVDSATCRVLKYRWQDLTYVGAWGFQGGALGQMNDPCGIAVDNAGCVWVADTGNNRVQKFGPNGQLLAVLTGFSGPRGVAVSGTGEVYVLDTGNNRVRRFSPALHPAFAADLSAGYAPLSVQFTDYTTGGAPDSWHWDFGDGATSTVQDPVHVYQEPGLYDVTLTVSSASQPGGSVLQQNLVRVLPPLWNGLVRVEAEDYDRGGEGVAYHDTTPGNEGRVYRFDDVDIAPLGPTGYVVNATEDGEWTRYTVYSPRVRNVTYPLALRVAASAAGRSIEVMVDKEKAATVEVPATRGFVWVNTTVVLPPGQSTLRFIHRDASPFGRAELDFDFFTLDPAGATLTPSFTAEPRTGYEPLSVRFTDTSAGFPVSWFWDFGDGTNSTEQNPVHAYDVAGTYTVSLTVTNVGAVEATATRRSLVRVLPIWNDLIRVEAEDYDRGGEGTSYHDTTLGNAGHVYRFDGVDITALDPTGYAVNATEDGEWTRYTVLSEKPGTFTYPLALRVRTTAADRSIDVMVNGAKAATVDVPVTGLRAGFAWANATVDLAPGENTLRFTHREKQIAGTGDLSFDFFALDPSGVVVTPTPTLPVVVAVPPGNGMPTDPDRDGKYEDVNGNGRADFADVVLYFNAMGWIAANEPIAAFDYNMNGRIDFADVVWLFNHL